MAEKLKPGQIAPRSGEYGIVGPRGGQTGEERTAVKGKPPGNSTLIRVSFTVWQTKRRAPWANDGCNSVGIVLHKDKRSPAERLKRRTQKSWPKGNALTTGSFGVTFQSKYSAEFVASVLSYET